MTSMGKRRQLKGESREEKGDKWKENSRKKQPGRMKV